ncbi:unnamed protein product [Lepidochelys kempii]
MNKCSALFHLKHNADLGRALQSAGIDFDFLPFNRHPRFIRSSLTPHSSDCSRLTERREHTATLSHCCYPSSNANAPFPSPTMDESLLLVTYVRPVDQAFVRRSH